ncbi:NamA [Pseudohyphozyma bogoriensis]|nr:NamA [Pseudohyphozyma bogoriensis]
MPPSGNLRPLSQPITFPLTGKTAPNRIYRSPQSEYACTYYEEPEKRELCGVPTPELVKRYQGLADGGAGLIVAGNIPIHRDFLENEENAVLDMNNPWDPVEPWKPAIQAAKSKGALFLAQLQFPGRQTPTFINPKPKSASTVQLPASMGKEYGKPEALTDAEIKDLITRFKWAAGKLAEAGADGVMLHASHGYLITQFLSPKTNKRTDKYGGSLPNRARFLLELVEALKEAMPVDKYIISVKYNCHDFIEGGTSFAESCVVLHWLEKAGVDFIDISGGTYESPAWRGNIMKELNDRESQKTRGSYFIEWAREQKKILSRAVCGTTGGWRDSHMMAQAIEEGEVDMRPAEEQQHKTEPDDEVAAEPTGLRDLPNEVLLEVLSYCSSRQLVRLALVCRALAPLAQRLLFQAPPSFQSMDDFEDFLCVLEDDRRAVNGEGEQLVDYVRRVTIKAVLEPGGAGLQTLIITTTSFKAHALPSSPHLHQTFRNVSSLTLHNLGLPPTPQSSHFVSLLEACSRSLLSISISFLRDVLPQPFVQGFHHLKRLRVLHLRNLTVAQENVVGQVFQSLPTLVSADIGTPVGGRVEDLLALPATLKMLKLRRIPTGDPYDFDAEDAVAEAMKAAVRSDPGRWQGLRLITWKRCAEALKGHLGDIELEAVDE